MRNFIKWESWLFQLISFLKYVTELANFSQRSNSHRRFFFFPFHCRIFFFYSLPHLLLEEVYKIYCFTLYSQVWSWYQFYAYL